jgi:TolA-binding protein
VAKIAGKLLIYGLLLAAAVFFFGRFKSVYQEGEPAFATRMGVYGEMGAEAGPPGLVETNELTTNEVADSRSVATGAAASGLVRETSVVPPGTTNEGPAGTGLESGSVGGGNGDFGAVDSRSATLPPGKSSSAIYLAGFIFSLLGLAIIGGWDVVTWFSTRSTKLLGAEVEPADTLDPEYEAAEEEWARGNHLEAINMMRQFLKKFPSEQYAAIRISEIYEKDLRNYLAAALELEEVLTKRLPREKWGWTAIHLSNLYSGKLNQPEKALGVLQRIVGDYPETAAAKKARQRLGLPEPDEFSGGQLAEKGLTNVAGADEDGASNLPPGFRIKKR